MRFDEILTAHGFMRTERPPLMWEADTDDERFIPLLGEMIVVGLNAGNELAQLTLAVSNDRRRRRRRRARGDTVGRTR